VSLIRPATDEVVRRAADILRRGGLVAFPSETVYGLGADATNPTAVARIFEVKERPHFDPLIIHLASTDWLKRYIAAVPSEAAWLAGRYWPGPLTLVLPKRDLIPDIVTAGLPTVAVRVPSHPVAHAMIERAGVPIAAPSANRFGQISPTTAQAVADELGERIDLILDDGSTRHGVESTIVEFAEGGPRLLRPGPVSREELSESLGREILLATHVPATPSAPGQLPRHYAPTTPLRLVNQAGEFTPQVWKKVGLLAFRSAPHGDQFAAVEILSPRGDLRHAAANLFSALRRLDAVGLDLIVAETVPATGIGLAIMDRLRKAATIHD
jgi:L-threonylcarbamoyladenylate synthase